LAGCRCRVTRPLAAALVHGYASAAAWAAVILLVAAAAVGLLVTARPAEVHG
jgi:hypothetical protein